MGPIGRFALNIAADLRQAGKQVEANFVVRDLKPCLDLIPRFLFSHCEWPNLVPNFQTITAG